MAGSSINPNDLELATSLAVPPNLEAETERLLSLRTRDIRMSPKMLRAYRSMTWPQRSKIARSWMIWVGLIAMAFVPVSYLLAPHTLWYTAIAGGIVVPGMHACAYLVWRKPRSAAVEGASLVLLMSGVMIVAGGHSIIAGGSEFERLLTGILFVHAIAIVVFQVDALWSVALMVCSLAVFFCFELVNPAIGIQEAIGTVVFYAMCMYAATTARQTQSILAQKTFLMSLRDQYRSESLKSANQQLEVLATRDPLTGLGNRRSAAGLIDKLWNERRTPKTSIAFVMADIDLFKRLNDSAGHAAGDVCIQRVAATIAQMLRSSDDAVFRYGGEEFLIVLSNATPDLAVELAERIRRAVEALAIINPGLLTAPGRKGVVTISLGIAFARDGAAPELVAKWADQALYDAKRSGRNAVVLSAGHGAVPATAEPPCGFVDASPDNSVRLIA